MTKIQDVVTVSMHMTRHLCLILEELVNCIEEMVKQIKHKQA